MVEPVDPVVDPVEPIPEDGGKEDTPLDPEENRESNDTADTTVDELEDENEIILSDLKETDKVTLTLVILLCALAPLICILGCVLYQFRKNKVHAEREGIARRNSSMRALEQRLEAKRNQASAQEHILDIDSKQLGGEKANADPVRQIVL